jgi:hypothetical protein
MRSKWGPIRTAPPDWFRAALAALFFSLLSSCGGGGGSSPAAGPIVPVTPRAGLHMGYYWGCAPYMIEQADHVDTWWATGYCNAPGAANDESIAWHLRVAAELQQARGAGIRNIVIMRDMTDLAGARFDLTRLSDGGYFNGWDSITFYPIDEPGSAQGGRKTDAEVTELVTKVKQLALDIPGLAGAHTGVFYGCTDPKPGIKAYDRVGCFRYGGNGCAQLEGDYAALRSQLSAGARLWMIPGGADIGGREGRQDPACWASYAHRNLDVWGVIGFLWQTVDGNPPLRGIRENGMRALYCEMGRVILRPNETPRC